MQEPMIRLARLASAAVLALIAAGASAQVSRGDLNEDGVIDAADVVLLLNEMAEPSGTQAAAPGGGGARPLPTQPPCLLSLCDPVQTCGASPTAHAACIGVDFNYTAWQICVENVPYKGLYLREVSFRRPGQSAFTQVLKSAGIAEIFVPYHEGDPSVNVCDPNRYYDTQWCGTPPGCMDELSLRDLPIFGGHLITFANESVPRLALECRERGLAWLCKGSFGEDVYRGQELVLWGVLDSGNYDNIIQYVFRDDGVIEFRHGVTGYNSPAFPPVSTTLAHMHDVLWRVDVDLDGPANDSVSMYWHEEGVKQGCPPQFQPLTAVDSLLAFAMSGREGAFTWFPEHFMTILVEDDARTNGHGNQIGYELVPWNWGGTPRHLGFQETWTQSDFFATVYHANEDGDDAYPHDWLVNFRTPDEYLLSSLNSEVVTGGGNDIVLWCHTGAHHDPHDEDHAIGDPANEFKGVTNIHWSGFDLVPHDFMDYNPLGGPSRCGG